MIVDAELHQVHFLADADPLQVCNAAGTHIKRSSGVFSGICCGFASKIEVPAQVGYAGTARSADIYERGLGIDEASMLSETLP